MTCSIYSVKKSKMEDPLGSPLLSLFATFLATLPRLIEAERDLCGYSGQDPAVDQWIRAADASLEATKTACAAVLAAPAAGCAELNLQRVARLFMDAIRSADPVEVARLRAHARLRRWAYSVPTEIDGAGTFNMMICEALDQCETWLALEDAFDARAEDFAGPDLDLSADPDLGPAF